MEREPEVLDYSHRLLVWEKKNALNKALKLQISRQMEK